MGARPGGTGRGRLDAEAEADLAKRAVAGRAAARLHAAGRGRAPLSAAIAAGGADAEAALVEAHTGLVAALVSGFKRVGVDRDDLTQEGLVALLGAVRDFDPGRGVRLATFAVPRISGALTSTVAAAAAGPELPRAWARLAAQARRERGRPSASGAAPSDAAVAAALDVTVDVLRRAESAAVAVAVADGDGSDLPDAAAVEDAVLAGERRRQLVADLATVGAPASVAAAARFGLFGGTSVTLAEAAALFGVDVATICRWERDALTQVRARQA